MPRVLLADDDADVLAALQALLAIDPGIDIVAAVESGTAALRLLPELKPDVLVLDVRMPGSGPDLVRKVRALPIPPAIVCFSADRSSRQMMLSAGAYAFADKADPQVDLIALVYAAHRAAGTKPA